LQLFGNQFVAHSLSTLTLSTPSLRPPEFRILFQVRYPATPFFATLTKTAGVVWVLAEIASRKARSPSHSGTLHSALVTRHEPPVHGSLPCSLSLQIGTFVFNRFHNAPPAISFFSNFCISARGCTPPNSNMHLPLHFSSPLRAIYLGALHPAQPRAEIPALPLSTFDFRPVSH